MKFPSISQIVADARSTFARFPFVLLDSIFGTVCGLVLIDFQGSPRPTVLIPLVFGAILGIPLLTGLAHTSEKRKWGRVVSLGLQLAGILFVGLYSKTVPYNLAGAPDKHSLQLLMLTLGMVLFAFAAPYLKHENELGYWNFCKIVCLRVFTAFLYTIVLYGGLALALAALDNLFGVDIPGKRYGELVVFIIGVFSVWFFLAGIPKEPESIDSIVDYPKVVKIFSLYILFPLVLIYFVILYAYLGKILLTWDWPQGWVSRLILGFISTGLVTLLLIHPIKDRLENSWIRAASKWFYVIIIPLIIMLFLAVLRRVSEYGITEGRYLGFATVVWLCVLTPYFILSSKKRILFIPATLCIAVLVVSFGQWGMFKVSEKSQVHRLKELLVNHHILVNGRVQSKHDSLKHETTRQISSILGYLSAVHGFSAIQPWFSESLKQDTLKKKDAYKDPEYVAYLMEVTYVQSWRESADGAILLTADRDKAVDIDGYERLLRAHRFQRGFTTRDFADHGIAISVGEGLNTMTIKIRSDSATADSFRIELNPIVEKLIAEYSKASTDKIPQEKMTVVSGDPRAAIKVFLSTIRIQRHKGKSEFDFFDAEIAYKRRTGIDHH